MTTVMSDVKGTHVTATEITKFTIRDSQSVERKVVEGLHWCIARQKLFISQRIKKKWSEFA